MTQGICEFQPIDNQPGFWKCPNCEEIRQCSSPPKNRICGAGHTRIQKPDTAVNVRATESDYQRVLPACQFRGDILEGDIECQVCGQKRQLYDVYECEKHGRCSLGNRRKAGDPPLQACATCPDWEPVELTIPVKSQKQPWRGVVDRKPWEYQVTAIIPVLSPDKSLELVIELLRLQTEKPYILLIDTGSDAATVRWLESLRAPDVELHLLRFNAVCHPSEPVSIALDVAAARCQTRFAFYTHSDCFLTRQTALAELIELTDVHHVVGHQISPRPYAGWEEEVGHTLLMVDNDVMRVRGVSWSMREAMRLNGRAEYWPDYNRVPLSPNYPDTETNFNRALQAAGIIPFFTGTEANYQRNVDEWIDHVRSLAGSKIYSAEYQAKALQWLPDAVRDAQQRIEEWKQSDERS